MSAVPFAARDSTDDDDDRTRSIRGAGLAAGIRRTAPGPPGPASAASGSRCAPAAFHSRRGTRRASTDARGFGFGRPAAGLGAGAAVDEDAAAARPHGGGGGAAPPPSPFRSRRGTHGPPFHSPRDSWPPRLPFAARDWQRLTPQRLPFAGRDSARRSPEPRRVAEHHPVPARAPRQLRRPRPLRRHHLRRPLHLAPGAPRSIRGRDSTACPFAARDSPGPRLTTTTIDAPASICGAGLQGVAYCAWGGVGCVRLGPFPARDSPPLPFPARDSPGPRLPVPFVARDSTDPRLRGDRRTGSSSAGCTWRTAPRAAAACRPPTPRS